MKNLVKIIAISLFFAITSCDDQSALCPEAQRVEQVNDDILILEYQKSIKQYEIVSLDPISDEDQIKSINHEIFVIDLEIKRLSDFIEAIKESSDCI